MKTDLEFVHVVLFFWCLFFIERIRFNNFVCNYTTLECVGSETCIKIKWLLLRFMCRVTLCLMSADMLISNFVFQLHINRYNSRNSSCNKFDQISYNSSTQFTTFFIISMVIRINNRKTLKSLRSFWIKFLMFPSFFFSVSTKSTVYLISNSAHAWKNCMCDRMTFKIYVKLCTCNPCRI